MERITIVCPGCSQTRVLDASWARRYVRCSCGTAFQTPAQPGMPAVALRRCPACGALCPLAQQICSKCGYHFPTGTIDRLPSVS